MPASTERIIELIIKHLNGDLNQADNNELRAWIAQSEENKKIAAEFLDEKYLKDAISDMLSKEIIWQKVEERISGKKVIPLFRRSLLKWVAAASIILVAGLSGYFLFFNKTGKQPESAQTQEQRFKNDVASPANNRAMITLASGQRVYLDSVVKGQLAVQGNVKLEKLADGKIVYSSESGVQSHELVYNTLRNPRGSKVIEMTLADGSHVWLNAGSSITYPVAFVGNERKVSMTGEAYFEVAKEPGKKFSVDVNGVITEVLGTHFNINSYGDDGNTKVTLLEGSVKVLRQGQDDRAAIIKPGEQAVLSQTQDDKKIGIMRDVDVEEVMAWKDGKFVLNDATIESVMKDVERWYDVEVIYKQKINYHFVGSLPRDVPVSKLLKMLELTGRVSFLIEGKKITVME